MKKILSLLLLVPALALGQQRLPNRPNTALWKISRPGTPGSYILGTHHGYTGTFLDTLPTVKQLIHDAECVVVEGGDVDGALTRAAMAAPRKNIYKALFKPAEYRQIDQYLKPFDASLEMYDTAGLPPALLYVGMIIMGQQGSGSTYQGPNASMDEYVMKAGQIRQVPVVRLDSGFRMQTEWLTGPVGDKMLARRIVELVQNSSGDAGYNGHVAGNYYGRQLNYEFEKAVTLKDNPDNYHLLVERNLHWMPELMRRIQEHRCFVAVGYGHLAYSTGLLKLLQQQGYTVEPVPMR